VGRPTARCRAFVVAEVIARTLAQVRGFHSAAASTTSDSWEPGPEVSPSSQAVPRSTLSAAKVGRIAGVLDAKAPLTLHRGLNGHERRLNTYGKRRRAGRLESPLTDSNRRPPPYHALLSATGRNPRQRFWLVSGAPAL